MKVWMKGRKSDAKLAGLMVDLKVEQMVVEMVVTMAELKVVHLVALKVVMLDDCLVDSWAVR